MPFRSDERRPNKVLNFVNGRNKEGNCGSLSATREQDDNLANISGLAVGIKRKNMTNLTETPRQTSDTVSCSEFEIIQEQLKDLSLRLQRLEDKVGSDLEGIYDILKASRVTVSDNLQDSVV